jgi:hypothetical protein
MEYGLDVLKLQMPCGTAWGHNAAMPGYVTWSLMKPRRRPPGGADGDAGREHLDRADRPRPCQRAADRLLRRDITGAARALAADVTTAAAPQRVR